MISLLKHRVICPQFSNLVKQKYPLLSKRQVNHVSKPTVSKKWHSEKSYQVRSYSNIPSSLRQLSESFLNGTNTAYVDEMYEAWQNDPKSVHISWATFFKNIEAGAAPGEGWVMPPTLGTSPHFTSSPQVQSSISSAENDKNLEEHLKVQLLIRAYQIRGHELAQLDPLELQKTVRPPGLELSGYGFKESDLDREFFTSSSGLLHGILSGKPRRTLREIIQILEQTYCKSIGTEYVHLRSREQSNWIRQKIELDKPPQLTKTEKMVILNRLMWATNFEKFLATKWTTTKRYKFNKF